MKEIKKFLTALLILMTLTGCHKDKSTVIHATSEKEIEIEKFLQENNFTYVLSIAKSNISSQSGIIYKKSVYDKNDTFEFGLIVIISNDEYEVLYYPTKEDLEIREKYLITYKNLTPTYNKPSGLTEKSVWTSIGLRFTHDIYYEYYTYPGNADLTPTDSSTYFKKQIDENSILGIDIDCYFISLENIIEANSKQDIYDSLRKEVTLIYLGNSYDQFQELLSEYSDLDKTMNMLNGYFDDQVPITEISFISSSKNGSYIFPYQGKLLIGEKCGYACVESAGVTYTDLDYIESFDSRSIILYSNE